MAVLTWLLATFTDSQVAFADAGTTAASLVAQYMLNRKWIENWAVWIAVDIAFVALSIATGLWIIAALYALFVVLCVGGVARVASRAPRGNGDRGARGCACLSAGSATGWWWGEVLPAARRARAPDPLRCAGVREGHGRGDRGIRRIHSARTARRVDPRGTPDVRVVDLVDDTPVDFGSETAWDAHTATIRGLLDEPVDAVFTSDDYGAELARRLDAEWVQIDPGRVVNPVSGTAIRGDLAGHWSSCRPRRARADLAARIVVLGAESTGSTTLAEALAAELGTLWVPEYGREISVTREGGLDAPWRSDEFDLIVDRQIEWEGDALRRVPVPVLVCDTDVLATALWHERYVGTVADRIHARAARAPPGPLRAHGDEIPFVQDGMRDGEHIRADMQERFRAVLAAQPVPWLEVRGSVAERLAAALPECVRPSPGGRRSRLP